MMGSSIMCREVYCKSDRWGCSPGLQPCASLCICACVSTWGGGGLHKDQVQGQGWLGVKDLDSLGDRGCSSPLCLAAWAAQLAS